jgi:predicted Zn-dependent protease
MLHTVTYERLGSYATRFADLDLDPDLARGTRAVLCNWEMAASTSKARAAEVRTEKHRKTHALVQTWVSHEMRAALDKRARIEGRTLANLVRHELGKIVGIAG